MRAPENATDRGYKICRQSPSSQESIGTYLTRVRPERRSKERPLRGLERSPIVQDTQDVHRRKGSTCRTEVLQRYRELLWRGLTFRSLHKQCPLGRRQRVARF